MAVADGSGDVKEMIGARKWLSGKWDRGRYGDKMDVSVNVEGISIVKALEEARGRVIDGQATREGG